MGNSFWFCSPISTALYSLVNKSWSSVYLCNQKDRAGCEGLRWPALEVELNQVPPFPGISPAGNSSHFPFIFSKWKGMVIGGPWDQTDPSGLDCRGSSLCWFKLAKTQISHTPTDEGFLTRVRANLYITPSTVPGRQWPGNSLELSFSFPSW